jgi:acetate kinase
MATLQEAMAGIIDALNARTADMQILGIGHRIVHGGMKLLEHQLITPAVSAQLEAAKPLDLEHLPRETALIEELGRAFPGTPQVACFDTAFHRNMPTVAQLLPIPRHYYREGLRRFGFHGLSYTSLMSQLATLAGPEVAAGRVILAHLGAGASMAAVRGGRPIDTTMSFTPLSGLVMATRPGDLDPGLLVYLLGTGAFGDVGTKPNELAGRINAMLSSECGLLGVSELSGDMRDLIAARTTNPQATDAIDLFCAEARKHLCALAGTLGGVDTIVFSGGIGENTPEVLASICHGLEFLGITLDPAKEAERDGIMSAKGSRTTVRVIRSDEEATIRDIVQQVIRSRIQQ